MFRRGGMLNAQRKLDARLRMVEDAMPPHMKVCDEVVSYWPVMAEGANPPAKKIAALETRITQLECAAKGHGRTKTVMETGVLEVLCKTLTVGVDVASRVRHETPGAIYGDRIGTRTIVTCLDCGEQLDDTWEPKDKED